MTFLKPYFLCLVALLIMATPALAQDEKTDETKKADETKTEQETKQEAKKAEPTEETKASDTKAPEADTKAPEAETKAPEAETKAAEGKQELDTSLEGLLKKYGELNTEIDQTVEAFEVTEDPVDSIKLRDKYGMLVAEANVLVDGIRAAAVTKLEGGEKDQKTYETLLGILINETVFEKNQQAFETGELLINAGMESDYFDKASEAARLSPAGREVLRELAKRCAEKKADDLPRVKLTTSKGEIVLELYENEAPESVGNFVSLVKDGFYDGLKFHRVMEGFMAQAGCPKGDGTGGPGYNIKCECYQSDYRRHFRGALSMANKGPRNTGGSQFFITFVHRPDLDGKHTVFGRVIEGMDVVDSIQRIQPGAPDDIKADTIIKAEVLRDRGHEYAPTKIEGSGG